MMDVVTVITAQVLLPLIYIFTSEMDGSWLLHAANTNYCGLQTFIVQVYILTISKVMI